MTYAETLLEHRLIAVELVARLVAEGATTPAEIIARLKAEAVELGLEAIVEKETALYRARTGE